MSVNRKTLLFFVNTITKEVPYAGRCPPTRDNMTGLDGMDYSALRDLSWAGHSGEGFFTYDDARDQGVPPQTLDRMKAAAYEIEWSELDSQRAALIEAVRWRVDRNNDEVALGVSVTEPLLPLLEYIQAIRDLPTTTVDPFNIVWPPVPPLP